MNSFDQVPADDKSPDPIPNSPPPEQPDGTADGEGLKAEAHHHFEVRQADLVLVGRRALLWHALQFGEATADDVRRMVPLPTGANPKAFGAVPGPLAKSDIIEPCGYRKTARSVGHAREVKVWRLKNVGAAIQWLNNNPEPPAAGEGVLA